MTYNNENAMMETKKDFILPAMVEDDCISVDVSEDYEGLRLSFPRVKIPGGGSLQFEIPSDDPENPDYTKYIEGVILYNHDTCAYWPEGSEYDDKKAQIKSLGSLPLYVTNQGRIEKGLAIDEQLAALGIHPADLDLVLLSHLDCDHTNGLNLVADAKQILVSKDELLFAENKTPVNRIRYNADWWRSTKMQTFDWNGTEGLAGKSYDVFGDESLVMVNIPGHSKGLCALKITGSDGRFILLLRRWRLRPKIVGAADHIRHCR